MAILTMKALLKKSKSRKPSELVNHTRELLIFFNDDKADIREHKLKDKMEELTKLMLEIRTQLYGDGDSEPNKETCAQLTQDFFKDETFRLLIVSLPKLTLETRRNATLIVANLQRQQVQSRMIASDYLEKNIDLMDILIPGYVLESDHMKKFFDYIQIPNFEIASDAAATFKELMTRHKSAVAQFRSNNYDWFFQEYNSQLLGSENYITKRQAIKLLGLMLLDRSNSAGMVRYVCSLDNMRILMNFLRKVVSQTLNPKPEKIHNRMC